MYYNSLGGERLDDRVLRAGRQHALETEARARRAGLRTARACVPAPRDGEHDDVERLAEVRARTSRARASR